MSHSFQPRVEELDVRDNPAMFAIDLFAFVAPIIVDRKPDNPEPSSVTRQHISDDLGFEAFDPVI